jgi:hypothetical protein
MNGRARMATVKEADSRGRSAISLIETLIFTALALGLMSVAWGLMQKSGSIMDSATHGIDLQVGVRNLLENMVRDIGACHQVLDPPGGKDPRTNLFLVKPASDEIDARLARNPDRSFPFASLATPTTDQKMDAIRVSFLYDAARRTVQRKEEAGEFVARSDATDPSQLTRFAFAPQREIANKLLATSVETFRLFHVGYDPITGFIKPVAAAGLNPIGYEKTACIAVKITAQFDEGLYKQDRAMPKIEIATKIWSMKRRADETYREYFSSGDEDLRW